MMINLLYLVISITSIILVIHAVFDCEAVSLEIFGDPGPWSCCTDYYSLNSTYNSFYKKHTCKSMKAIFPSYLHILWGPDIRFVLCTTTPTSKTDESYVWLTYCSMNLLPAQLYLLLLL